MAIQPWTFPRPAGLRPVAVSDSGFGLEWEPVRNPAGGHPDSYTVETFQLNGVKVDDFTVHGTSTREYGRGGKGLHAGWTYKTFVRANGSPRMSPAAEIEVRLLPAEHGGGEGAGPPAPAPETTTPVGPSQGVKRAAVVASRATPATGGGHPALWQPWQGVINQAEARMRTELAEALREYEHDLAKAGRILDVAYAEASEVAGQLEDAAWTAWQASMAAAAEASDRIMGPAVRGYDQAIGEAHRKFSRSLDTAEQAHKQAFADAQRAQNDAPPAR